MEHEPRLSDAEDRVLIVSGSPRPRGNSAILAERIADHLRDLSVDGDVVRLCEREFSSCIGCELCREAGECIRFADGMTPLYEMIRRARGLVLITPVHNYNVTAWMKAFIDRLYCFYEFEEPRPGPWRSTLAEQGRRALVIAIAEQTDVEGAGFTLDAMRMPLEALGYDPIDELLVSGVFEKGEVNDHPESLAAADEAARVLAEAVCP